MGFMKTENLLLLVVFSLVNITCVHADEFKSTRTNASVKTTPQSFSFAVISDLNQSYGSTSYPQEVARSIESITSDPQIELVLSTGDMVAGQKRGLDYRSMWSAFHEAVTLPLTRSGLPFAPSPGNHDASMGKSYQEERDTYQDEFLNLEPSALRNQQGESHFGEIQWIEGSQFPFYYGFLYKNVLFVALDATGVGTLSSEQAEWVETVFRENQNVKGRILFGHVSLFPFVREKASEYLARGSVAFGNRFERLLDEYKVDLFITGHQHAYYQGDREIHTRYVSAPLLGSGFRTYLGHDSHPKSPRGFLKITFDGDSHFSVHAIRGSNGADFTNQIPLDLRVPGESSSRCKLCGEFPSEFFLDNTDRVLFYRSQTLDKK
tara:strand:- start:101486 stop:102619 length:1134 start_codon:yes stop_codon:yes gene_type:complete